MADAAQERVSDSDRLIIKSVTGKGLGLIAKTKLAKRTKVLSAAPLFILPRSADESCSELTEAIQDKLKGLSPSQRHTFEQLKSSLPDIPTLGVSIVPTPHSSAPQRSTGCGSGGVNYFNFGPTQCQTIGNAKSFKTTNLDPGCTSMFDLKQMSMVKSSNISISVTVYTDQSCKFKRD